MNLASLQGLYYEADHKSWLASTTHNMTRTDGSGDDLILHPNPNTDHNQRAAKNNSQHKSSAWHANKNGARNNADSQHHHCLHPRQHDPSQPRVGWTMMMSKTSRTMRSWMPAVEQKQLNLIQDLPVAYWVRHTLPQLFHNSDSTGQHSKTVLYVA